MMNLNSLIGRITQLFRNATQGIRTPFQQAAFQVRNLRTNNPLTMLRRSFQGLGRQFRYVVDAPRRLLGISLPTKWADRLGLKKPELDPKEELIAELPDSGRALKRNRLPQRAYFSQIHLVSNGGSGRTIVHIGRIIGRSEAEVILRSPHPPVQLRFSQLDPEQNQGASIRLSYLAGESAVSVDGAAVEQEALIRPNSILQIDGYAYQCELYPWDSEPVVTRVNASWYTRMGTEPKGRYAEEGLLRNEDAIGIYQDPKAYLFVISDGVGGGEAGDRMSEFAVQYLLTAFHQNLRYRFNWQDVLLKAYKHINAEVRHFSSTLPSAAGCTLTAVVIQGGEATIAHVGDSRAYVWHKRGLEQITTDHVLMQPVEMGTVEAFNLQGDIPRRSTLTKAIGKAETIDPQFLRIPLQPGDKLLLCTDGLAKHIQPEEIAGQMMSHTLRKVPQQLIEHASQRDDLDDASAVLIEVLKEAYDIDAWEARASQRVYVGRDAAWSLRLKRQRETYTSYPLVKASSRGTIVLIAALIAIFILFRAAAGGQNAAAEIASTSTPSPTITPSATLTHTATATLTPTFTATPSPRPSATTTPTLLPPTSTLRASNPVPGAEIRRIAPYMTNGA